MKKLFFILIFILSSDYAFNQSNNFFGDKTATTLRVNSIKQSTVKVFVDNNKSGTGFFISSDGLLLTNWHVIFNDMTNFDSTGKILSVFKVIDINNDTIPVSIAMNISNSTIVNEGVFWDYCVLKANKEIKTNFLKLGTFSTGYEGASVYTCGFPLNLNEPFISAGIISSFFKQTIKVSVSQLERQVAWLDMTTNKGNSGGPLMLLSDKPENDCVIGITSFIITPYYNILEDLNKYIVEMERRGGVELMGINFLQYVKLINTTANSNSVGISGCISIDKIAEKIKRYNK